MVFRSENQAGPDLGLQKTSAVVSLSVDIDVRQGLSSFQRGAVIKRIYGDRVSGQDDARQPVVEHYAGVCQNYGHQFIESAQNNRTAAQIAFREP